MDQTEEIVNQIMLSDVDFKLVVAKHYLSKISEKFPHNDRPFRYHKNALPQEMYIESFLYFSASAIEILTKQINQKLKIEEENKNYTILTIRKKIRGQKKFKKLTSIIDNYFTEIKFKETEITKDEYEKFKQDFGELNSIKNIIKRGNRFYSKWNEDNTSLWQLREIRNIITHRSLFGLAVSVYKHSSLLIPFEVKDSNGKILKYDKQILKPHEFFTKLFDDLSKFVKEIHKEVFALEKQYPHENMLSIDF